MKSNVKEDVCYAQPKTLEQRIAIANDFVERQKYPVPFGIDDMTNAANDAYSAWPERIYIIDEHGKIAYAGGMGPFNYHPEEARAWLAARYGEVKHDPQPASLSRQRRLDFSTCRKSAEGKCRGAARCAPCPHDHGALLFAFVFFALQPFIK